MSRSLWPKELIPVETPSLEAVLETQALLLPQSSGLRLYAEVRRRIIEPVTTFTFRIRPFGRQNVSYDLFEVNAPNATYPVAIYMVHFGDNRVIKAKTASEFETALAQVLQDPRTLTVLQSLADEARPIDQGEATQVVLIAEPFLHNGERYASASFFGVHTFLSKATVKKIADNSRDVFEQIDAERTVLTLKPEDQFKMTLSTQEATSLRKMARLFDVGRADPE